jgi:hypothetical protein
MTYFFCTIVFLVIVAVFVRKRRMTSSGDASGSHRGGYGIPATTQMLDAERQDNEEVMKLLESTILASGLFVAEKVPELVAKLRGASSPFARLNTKVAFEGNEILTVEEKRALGLNTRMKYTKDFTEYFDPGILKTIEPKAILLNMHLSAYHRVARQRDLLKLRDLGFVKQVTIVPVGDAGDCGKVKRLKKTYSLEAVPELPLPDCTAPFCRCMYEPVIPDSN